MSPCKKKLQSKEEWNTADRFFFGMFLDFYPVARIHANRKAIHCLKNLEIMHYVRIVESLDRRVTKSLLDLVLYSTDVLKSSFTVLTT
jgi:hypothetical protein